MATPMAGAKSRSQPHASGRSSGLARWARRAAVAIFALGLMLGALYLAARLTTDSFYWSRILIWHSNQFTDFKLFPQRPIPNGPAVSTFQPAPATVPAYLSTVTYQENGRQVTAPLASFLSANGTTAFLVIKGDQLLYEGYFNGSGRTATQTSFSVAKSVVSMLIGIAVDEGSIHSIDDPITRYLPEMAAQPGLNQVRIRDLLTMTADLRWRGPTSGAAPPWDDAARAYLDPNLRTLALSLPASAPPNTYFQYNSYYPVLLGMTLERATGRTVSQYLSEKLWQPLGMEAPGFWSLDSHHDGLELLEAGLNGQAIDFAKLGALYLNGGTWQGRQLVPSEWITTSTTHDPTTMDPSSNPAMPSRGFSYGYLWWLDPQAPAPGRYFAWGNLGQYIYVAPDRDVVVVRFGTTTGSLDGISWVSLLRNVASSVP
jgi:CubicO group peptidase (beta-lactamase class C family)